MKDLLRKNKLAIFLSIILLVVLGMINQVTFLISLGVMVFIHILRKSTLNEWGLSKPKSWPKIIFLSLTLAAVMMTISIGLDELINRYIEQPADISRFDFVKANIWTMLAVLLSVWLTAAFGEEILWRGYIMKNVALFLGDNKKAWIISLLVTSTLFGALHYYQGPVGMIKTGFAGLFLGIVYIANGKQNLWLNILIHGLLNTIAMVSIFLQSV